MFQAAVEEAEQELVGQTGGTVTMLSILCRDQQKDKNTQKESRAVKVNYSKKKKEMVHSIGDVNQLWE